MAATVDPNIDALGDDNESEHPSRAPVQNPGTDQRLFTMETDEELYHQNKKIAHRLVKIRQLLASATTEMKK
jgi:hypothetical protein